MPVDDFESPLLQTCVSSIDVVVPKVTDHVQGSVLPRQHFGGDLTVWHSLDPQHNAVISALALTIEKKNRGKQREELAILHLAIDQVYFLSITHTATDLSPLLESIGQILISCTKPSLSRRALEVQVGDSVDCTLHFLDGNPSHLDFWCLDRWRKHRTLELARTNRTLQPSIILAMASQELADMELKLGVETTRFLASLDQDILPRADQSTGFSVYHYNYLSHQDPVIRRNRKQALLTFPLLVDEIVNRSEPTPRTTSLCRVIDSGQKVIEWITKTFGVRPATAKALRHLSESDIGDHWRGKLGLLLSLLSTLPPERHPKTAAQWHAFSQALEFIKATTRHPIGSTSTGILLGEIARRNWTLEKTRNANLAERTSCIDAFVKTLGSALAACIQVEKLGIQGHPVPQAHSVASNALMLIGLRRVESLATKWQRIRRDSDAAFSARKPAQTFPMLLQEPFRHHDLWIVQLLSQDDLNKESASLSHCVNGYGADCQLGKSIMFSVRGPQGQPRSTFEIALRPLSLSVFEIKLIQHKAHNNNSPTRDELAAVSAFIGFLRGPELRPLLMTFSREKLLALLEPALARDYRYAVLMRSFLADSSHGRLDFDNMIASTLGLHAPNAQYGEDIQLAGHA